MKNRFVLVLLSLLPFFAYGQETMWAEPLSDEAPSIDTAAVAKMIKVVLGDVYVEVGHIPEPQWFEMEPIAEKFVKVYAEVHVMDDSRTATILLAEAKAVFDKAIDAMLTGEQKSAREKYRAEAEVWRQQKKEFATSPATIEAAYKQINAKGGSSATIIQK